MIAVYRLEEFRKQVNALIDETKIQVDRLSSSFIADEAQDFVDEANERIANAENYLANAEDGLKSMNAANPDAADDARKTAKSQINDARSNTKIALKNLREAMNKLDELIKGYNELIIEIAER